MSDPFDRLRDTDTTAFTPDLGAIRSRARQITRRRQQLLGGSAVAVALIAVAGIFFTTKDDSHRTATFAQREPTAAPSIEAAPFAAADTAAAPTDGDAQKRAADSSAEQQATGASTAGGSAAVTAPNTMSSAPAPLAVTLSVKDRSSGRGADLTLKACNQSNESVSRDFATSQRYDFEVSKNGAVVWKYSEGRAFAQMVGDESWAPKQCKTWTATWDGMRSSGGLAGPGTYEVVGVLSTDPPLRTDPQKYCLDVC